MSTAAASRPYVLRMVEICSDDVYLMGLKMDGARIHPSAVWLGLLVAVRVFCAVPQSMPRRTMKAALIAGIMDRNPNVRPGNLTVWNRNVGMAHRMHDAGFPRRSELIVFGEDLSWAVGAPEEIVIVG